LGGRCCCCSGAGGPSSSLGGTLALTHCSSGLVWRPWLAWGLSRQSRGALQVTPHCCSGVPGTLGLPVQRGAERPKRSQAPPSQSSFILRLFHQVSLGCHQPHVLLLPRFLLLIPQPPPSIPSHTNHSILLALSLSPGCLITPRFQSLPAFQRE